jgi:lysophospholipase L1-like esterase
MRQASAMRLVLVALLLAVDWGATWTAARAQAGDFPLLDGDVVVTLGDSNTGPGTYQQVLERFTTMRYPSRRIRYINMGLGGDTAAGGLARLQRDVFDRGATVLFVTYGVNDICWGLCDDDAHRQAYFDAIVRIVVECINRGVRVYVTTYPYLGAANTALHDMTAVGMALSRYGGQSGIDIYDTMKALDPNPNAAQQCFTDAQRCPTAFQSACNATCNTWTLNDGVHLSEKAQRAWAYALLKGLGAPGTASAVTLDAWTQRIVAATGATVTNVVWNATQRRLTFYRLDEGQPLTFNSNTESYFNNLQVPFHTLSRLTLKVTNLPAGTYRITVGGQLLGNVTHTALGGAGVDLATFAPAQWSCGGAWMIQNPVVAGLVAARAAANRLMLQVTPGSAVDSLLGSADAVVGLVQRWVATPTDNAVVIEPAGS